MRCKTHDTTLHTRAHMDKKHKHTQVHKSRADDDGGGGVYKAVDGAVEGEGGIRRPQDYRASFTCSSARGKGDRKRGMEEGDGVTAHTHSNSTAHGAHTLTKAQSTKAHRLVAA